MLYSSGSSIPYNALQHLVCVEYMFKSRMWWPSTIMRSTSQPILREEWVPRKLQLMKKKTEGKHVSLTSIYLQDIQIHVNASKHDEVVFMEVVFMNHKSHPPRNRSKQNIQCSMYTLFVYNRFHGLETLRIHLNMLFTIF